ncbi:MAG TPA: dihydrolipoamide acetyltransferase family protein [Tepidisphaeraceae bacterium]|nr:dihydrolipoamide acetyltransferase family protein [Tepidisphaeraceae bacterium]
MPQLSDTMTEGTVVKWYKKEGEKVKSGEKVADVETDKAVMEMESFDSGTIAVILAPEGSKVPVGGSIAVVASAKEDPGEVKKRYASGAPKKAPATSAQIKAEIRDPLSIEAEPASLGDPHKKEPATASVATIAPPKAGGNGHGSNGGRIFASPLARRIAEENGLELASITGSGPGGRIIQRDVLGFKRGARSGAAISGSSPEGDSQRTKAAADLRSFAPKVASGEKTVTAMTKMRQTIANRLQQSMQTLPHFYETVDIDIESLVGLRERVNKSLEKSGVRLSVGDFVAKAVAMTLLKHPSLNSHYNGQTAEVTSYGDVNLGMAVALENGLIVPVLRNIDKMGLAEIRARSADLVDRARAQKLKQDEMTGATFTVSNLGTHGIRQFTAIINPPEVAILAVGAAEKRAVVRGDAIVARTIMSVTLSSDHRVVDGAAAADFLKTLRALLEEPGMMLV